MADSPRKRCERPVREWEYEKFPDRIEQHFNRMRDAFGEASDSVTDPP